MLHNNIYYEFDKILQKYVLMNSNLFKRFQSGKIVPINKKDFILEYQIVDTYKNDEVGWNYFNSYYDLHHPRTLYRYLENVLVFKNNIFEQYVLTFQPNCLLFDRYLEVEEHFKDKCLIGINYEKTWLIPGKTPLFIVATKESYHSIFKRFDTNLRKEKKIVRTYTKRVKT